MKIMDTKNPKGSCEHEAPAVIVDATGQGYRILCRECGAVGPQREDSKEVWADLQGWRYQEANPSRRTSLY